MVTRNPLLTSPYFPALQQSINPVTPDTNRNTGSQVCQISGVFQPRANAVPKEAGDKKCDCVTKFVLIVEVLLASETGMLTMQDICAVISEKYRYYKNSDKWKGGVRHTLSINDCFSMIPRTSVKRGALWAIHRAALEDLKKGDYNRRKANRNVQHWHQANNA